MSQAEAANVLNRIEMSDSLRGSLQRAITYAYEQAHRQVTLEHLMLALAEDREAAVILEASAVDVTALTTDISDHLGRLEDRVGPGERREPVLGGDVLHIIQSAGAAAQKSRRHAVNSALVLAALVGDGRSPSAQMLRNHGLTFEHAIEALKKSNAASAQQRNETQPTARPAATPAAATVQPAAQPAAQPAIQAVPAGTDPKIQNVQAAQDIIANARERIAAARNSAAVPAPAEDEPNTGPPKDVGRATGAANDTAPELAVDTVRSGPDLAAETTPVAKPQVAAPPVTPPAAAPNMQEAVRTEPVQQRQRQPAAETGRPADDNRDAPRPTLETDQNGAMPDRSDRKQAVLVPSAPSAAVAPDVQPVAPAQQFAPQVPPDTARPPQAPRTLPPNPPQQLHAGPPPAPPQARPSPSVRPAAHAAPAYPTMPPQRDPHPYFAAQAQQRMQQAPPPPSMPQPPRPGHGAEPRAAEPAPAQSYPAAHAGPPPAAANPIEPESLLDDIPERMCVGVPKTIEIRAPRARLEAWSGGGSDPRVRDEQIITKAMAMRLRAPDGDFTIEIASPETQWSEGYVGPLSDDVVSWRWIVTPLRRGRAPLQLNVSIRVVGRDGLAAERALPAQIADVRVSPNYGRFAGRAAMWLLIACSGAAFGYFGERLFNMGRSVIAQVMQ